MDNIKAKYVLNAPYYPQIQRVFEAFNKTRISAPQKFMTTVRKLKTRIWLRVKSASFPSYYNWMRQHFTNWQSPKYLVDNFNNQNIREIVSFATEKSMKKYYEQSWWGGFDYS